MIWAEHCYGSRAKHIEQKSKQRRRRPNPKSVTSSSSSVDLISLQGIRQRVFLIESWRRRWRIIRRSFQSSKGSISTETLTFTTMATASTTSNPHPPSILVTLLTIPWLVLSANALGITPTTELLQAPPIFFHFFFITETVSLCKCISLSFATYAIWFHSRRSSGRFV